MQTIRRISLSVDESDISSERLNRKTDKELKNAFLDFYDWWESVVEKRLTIDEQNDGSTAISSLRDACVNYAREDGIRTGIRIMHEALSEFPTITDIELDARRAEA